MSVGISIYLLINPSIYIYVGRTFDLPTYLPTCTPTEKAKKFDVLTQNRYPPPKF